MPDFSNNNRRDSLAVPEKGQRLRLLLGDRHHLLLEMMVSLLEPEFEIVGTETDEPTLLRAAQSLEPDVVVLEVDMPRMSGIEVARHLQVNSPAMGIILLGTESTERGITEALKNGGAGYVPKSGLLSEARDAIFTVANGGRYLAPTVAGGTGSDIRAPGTAHAARLESKPSRLTIGVACLLICGLSIRTIALQLGIAPSAVERYQQQAMQMLAARDNHEPIALALSRGWFDDPAANSAWSGPASVSSRSRSFDQIATVNRRKAADTDEPDLKDAHMQLSEGYEALVVWQDIILAAGDAAHKLETHA